MPFSNPDRLQAALWIGFGIVLLWLLAALGPILSPFLLAGILAYICNPLVDHLQGTGLPRAAGTLLVILALFAAVILLVLMLVPLLRDEAVQLATRLPDAVALYNEQVVPWIRERFGLNLKLRLDPASLKRLATENWDSIQALAQQLYGSLKIGGVALVGLLANLFLAPVVMFYLLLDWHPMIGRLAGVVPRPWHPKVLAMAADVDAVLSEFLRGQVLVMLALAVYYVLALWIAGLEYALPVGVLTGLLVFVPYLGYATGFILALTTAILQFEGWSPIVGTLAVFGFGQALESFVLTPRLVGERIGLHPLAVIFALMAFGQLFGFFGVLLALPASAALLVGLREVRRLYLASSFYRGQP
ncbi:MAG: AI-2E family transporter [Rhodocyclaceae bacterium]|nr:AI-2E family transporter [Rhodocyclaceae bacterium]